MCGYGSHCIEIVFYFPLLTPRTTLEFEERFFE